MGKVLFLDVDGVFTSRRAHAASGQADTLGHWSRFDPLAVEFINRHFGPESGWQVVVSSSWGKLFDLRAMNAIMGAAGFRVKLADNWNTPKVGHSLRGDEVAGWLALDPSEKYDYIILDDDADFLPEQLGHLVQTDGKEGMLSKHYEQVLCLKQIIDNKDKA